MEYMDFMRRCLKEQASMISSRLFRCVSLPEATGRQSWQPVPHGPTITVEQGDIVNQVEKKKPCYFYYRQ